jgi:hypothetical protein
MPPELRPAQQFVKAGDELVWRQLKQRSDRAFQQTAALFQQDRRSSDRHRMRERVETLGRDRRMVGAQCCGPACHLTTALFQIANNSFDSRDAPVTGDLRYQRRDTAGDDSFARISPPAAEADPINRLRAQRPAVRSPKQRRLGVQYLGVPRTETTATAARPRGVRTVTVDAAGPGVDTGDRKSEIRNSKSERRAVRAKSPALSAVTGLFRLRDLL